MSFNFFTAWIGAASIALAGCGNGATTEIVGAKPAAVATGGASARHNTLSEAETKAGFELLFDGSDVGKLRGYNREDFPDRGWRVENGELIVEYSGAEEDGYGGDVITREKYRDFEFLVDFALSDTSNSGAFYLVQEVPEQPIWHSAPEYQMLDDATYKVIYDGLTDRQLSGANYDLHEQKVDYSNPIGAWNTARIVKRGARVEHYLNDSLVVAYDLHDADWERRYKASKFVNYPTYASVDEGYLGLQDHGHRVRFRNIKVRRL